MAGKLCAFSILFPYSVDLMEKNIVSIGRQGNYKWKEPSPGVTTQRRVVIGHIWFGLHMRDKNVLMYLRHSASCGGWGEVVIETGISLTNTCDYLPSLRPVIKLGVCVRPVLAIET